MVKYNGLARNEFLEEESQKNATVKSKPRYSDDENEMIYENWWNPKLRKELSHRFSRKISALRSQFCRILKEKGISNTDYYKIMRAKYQTQTPRELLAKDEDQLILEIFAKHQVLGGTRNEACNELQKILKKKISEAALKLRFYRLMQKRGLSEEDVTEIGQDILNKSGMVIPDAPLLQGSPVKKPGLRETITDSIQMKAHFSSKDASIEVVEERKEKPEEPPLAESSEEKKSAFLYQLAHLPEALQNLEEKVSALEKTQKHQLDLRGFIEHLLAVERDLKKEENLLIEIDRLVAENDSLQGKLEKERDRLSKRERELTEIHEILNSMLSDFMHLESVAKLASLGDFIHRLEITVDQFGNVMKSRRIQGA